MRKIIPTISLIAALSGLTTAANAQLVVWSQNFDSLELGQYPPIQPVGGDGPPWMFIVAPGEGGTGQALLISFDVTNGETLYLQCATFAYPASGNTNPDLSKYTLAFDLAVEGDTPGFDMAIGVLGPSSEPRGSPWLGLAPYIFISRADLPAADSPSTGSGYKHFSVPMNTLQSGLFGPLDPTYAGFGIGFGFLGQATITDIPESVYVDNITITMNTNLPPPPTLSILPAKPGLRIFAGSSVNTYDREMLYTVDQNQSWVDPGATFPVKYSFSLQDLNLNIGQTMVELIGGGTTPTTAGEYADYSGPTTFWMQLSNTPAGPVVAWVQWKTNLPGANPNITATVFTNSTAIGTWSLVFTGPNTGYVGAPGQVIAGSTNFTIADGTVTSDFADPVFVGFGLQPNSTAGEGTYEDWGMISVTGVVDGTEFEDFTTEGSDIGAVTPNVTPSGFFNNDVSALPASTIIQTTNTPYWLYWNVPDQGFGLATKASLNSGTNVWFSPAYYASGVGISNTVPTQMGLTNKWTLIPKACLPTVDGTPGGPVSPTGFFRLQNPAPSQ